jgi:hypothetical protein
MVAADSVCGRIDDAATAEFTPMAISFSPTQLERFRREAKKLGRDLSITHSEALDRIAARHSFQNWSLLAKHSDVADTPSAPSRQPVSVVPPGPPTRRYCIHGDVKVDEPTLCFCVRCDAAVEPTHFDGLGYHGDGGDGERYLASLARHNALARTRKVARGRPDDAPNVLAARAVAERDAYQASRSTLHRWLDGQRKRDDIVGHLAGDILRDKTFPVGLSTREELDDRLSWHGEHIVQAIEELWAEFAASRGSMSQ